MIEQLRQFIPYAGNTHSLQWRKSAESNWFMDTVRKVNLRGERNETTQGFYVVDAAGGAYGWNNNRDVDRVLGFMRSGLTQYRSVASRDVLQIQPKEDGIPDPPAGATVLRVYQRIMPVPKGADSANENVQRDHFWLLASESAALVKGQVADTLSLRLCRFVFNDAIRGEPDMWRPQEISERSFSASRKGDVVTLEGSFAMATAKRERGLKGKLTAEIRFSGERVVGFKGVADTTAWGQSNYTPNPPKGEFPLKFAFILAPTTPDTVAPQATNHGASYLTGR